MGSTEDQRRPDHGRQEAPAHGGGFRAYPDARTQNGPAAGRRPQPYAANRPQQGGYVPAGATHARSGQAGYGSYPPGGYQPGSNGHHDHDDLVRVRKKRKKHRTLKRVLLGVLIAVLVLVGAGVGYGAWYMNSLASNIAMDSQQQEALDEVLTPVDTQAAPDAQEQPYYVLLVGSDNWETYGERSDALMLVRIDPANYQVTIVSIPRDTPYMLNGQKVKINQAFAENGPVGAVEAVQQLTGVPISYYAEIEFAGLATFVDEIGGIYVDVPYTIDYNVYTGDQDTVHIEAGLQRLDGEQCVALARMRTAYGDNQDAMRQSNVRAMTEALLKSVLQASPASIPGLVQQLSACVSTNMSMQDLTSLALDFAQAPSMTLYTCTGPYQGDIDADTGLWLCYENPEGWASLMAAVEAGDDPSSAATTYNGK